MAVRDEVERDDLEDNGAIGVVGVRGVVLGVADEGAGGGAVDERDGRHAKESGAREEGVSTRRRAVDGGRV